MFDSRKYHREYQRKWLNRQRRSPEFLAKQREAQRRYYHKAKKNPEWAEQNRAWHREYQRKRRKNPEVKKANYAKHKKWVEKNREYLKRYMRAWNKQPCNVLKRRIKMLEKKYGIPYSQFESLLEIQNGVCAICSKILSVAGIMSHQKAVVDHDHATGRVRGILCSICNLNVHVIEKYPNLIEPMMRYLQSSTIKKTQ